MAETTHERQAEKLAQMFHETYERLAPAHGYKTRDASAVPWEDVPAANKSLMIAVASCIYDAYMTTQLQQVRAHGADQRARAEQAERELAEARAAIEHVRGIHRKSLFVAPNGTHRGKHYCMSCTFSADDWTYYEPYPCATAADLPAPQRPEDAREETGS